MEIKYLDKRYQKLVNTFSIELFGMSFVRIGPAVEARQLSKEMGFKILLAFPSKRCPASTSEPAVIAHGSRYSSLCDSLYLKP